MGTKYKISLGIIITILVAISIYQYVKIKQLHSQIEMINPTVSSRAIQNGLVQLESEINYQKTHDWESPELLTVRIQNILEGISVTIEAGHHVDTLSEQDRNALWDLHRFFYKYTENKKTHELILNEEEKRDFEELTDRLKKNGWGLNIGFSSDWHDFMRRTNSFLSNSR